MKISNEIWWSDKIWYATFRILFEIVLVVGAGGLVGMFFGADIMFGTLAGYLTCRVARALAAADWWKVRDYIQQRCGKDQFVTQPDSIRWTVIDNRHLDRLAPDSDQPIVRG